MLPTGFLFLMPIIYGMKATYTICMKKNVAMGNHSVSEYISVDLQYEAYSIIS